MRDRSYWLLLGTLAGAVPGGGCVAAVDDTGALPAAESGDVNGVVFKGPMQAESVLTVEPLGPDGALAGDVLTAAIADASGSYSVTGVPRGLVRVTAEGEALNEAEGAVDARPIRMVAYAELGGPEQAIHVNLLTDLTHLRVERLLGEGATPRAAIDQAQRELREGLIIGAGGAPEGLGEAVDPYGEGFDAAWLFAFSGVVAQAGQDLERAGEGTLSDFVDAIREDLADDGRVAEELRGAIVLAEENFNPDLATQALDTHAVDYALTVRPPDPHPALDTDHDGYANSADNCRYVANDQADSESRGFGDACDYRLADVASAGEWGCAVLGETGEITCWRVDAEPLGGAPPRPDRYPVPAEAPWGDATGLPGGGYGAVALGESIACAAGAEGVSCWEEGVGAAVYIEGRWRDVQVSEGLVCASSAEGAVACVARTGEARRVDIPGPAADYALLGGGAVCTLGAADGAINCVDADGAAVTPPDLPTGTYTSLSASSAGDGWGCAVSAADGTLDCFGGSSLVESALTDDGYVDVVVGEGVACALWASGAPACWRDEAACPEVGEAPPSVTDVVANGCQVCGVDPSGLGVCWPLNWDMEHPPPE